VQAAQLLKILNSWLWGGSLPPDPLSPSLRSGFTGNKFESRTHVLVNLLGNNVKLHHKCYRGLSGYE